MKFMISVSVLVLLIPILSIAKGNAQTEVRSQPSSQPICAAMKPAEQAIVSSEPLATQRSDQAQKAPECALKPQPKSPQTEPPLSEHDRLIKERSEQRIIPPQKQPGDQQ
jgi:hypothetical protein